VQQRRDHLPVVALQRFAQREVRLVERFDGLARRRAQEAEASLVQAGLVAEVVADGGDVGVGRLGDLARRSLGEALLAEQANGRQQQALARLLAIRARLADLVGRRGRRVG
jgi:hypothetical protein